MTEIASLVHAAFADIGLRSKILTDGLPTDAPDTINIVVAPHEYFGLLSQYSQEDHLQAARHCIPIATEQPGTKWFEESLAYCKHAPFVFDINEAGVAALGARGLTAHYFPLGYHASWDIWGGDLSKRRQVDLLFLGSMTRRRERFLARHADLFADYNCRFIINDPARPVVGPQPNFVAGDDKYRLLADAKILLNVHRADAPYFEWHRALGAMANGCLVLTEPTWGCAPLRPFTHFIEAPLDVLGHYAVALLVDRARREQIIKSAYSVITQELRMSKILEGFLPLLEAHATRPGDRRATPFPVENFQEHTRAGDVSHVAGRARSALGGIRRGAVAVLKVPLAHRRAWRKTLHLRRRAQRQEAEAVACRKASVDPASFEIVRTPVFDVVTPDLTVVVTVYNYERYVDECLESILGSVGVMPEVLVVNDHSVDRSEARVLDFLSAHPDFPVALISRKANRGLAEARNLGFRLARTDYVFVLDVDNAVYPHALLKLRSALLTSGAHFAYSMLEGFGEGARLVSAFPWEVDRLVRGNYIDAMALIRRSAWESVGGYCAEDILYGWEDYDLWLSFAERGFWGVLVPEILARYRFHPTSMLSVTNLDLITMYRHLRVKHRRLPWNGAHP